MREGVDLEHVCAGEHLLAHHVPACAHRLLWNYDEADRCFYFLCGEVLAESQPPVSLQLMTAVGGYPVVRAGDPSQYTKKRVT